ncbi:hypothetical protein Fmac_000223 [Flemingia macrophylla]|uniref:BZIP domain-containing protein n=1 Tax=Flemingia macrophylla TaxID=520843 RepID=A0ABD1NEB0_9FABA
MNTNMNMMGSASASSAPCDCDWTHLSDSSSSLSQTPSSSVWPHIKLPSLSVSVSVSNSTVDFNHSSFLNQPPSVTPQDQRRTRIIKNRESAARSRARKQAYRKGLEAEIARLTEENSRLSIQLEELRRCMSSIEHPPKKSAPCRTLSSPF